MELKDTCKILLDKGNKQKIKCYKFFHKGLNRELAIHPNIDIKVRTNITDTITGLNLVTIRKEFEKVSKDDIKESIERLIAKYTLEEIFKEFEKFEKKQAETKEK